MNQTKFREKVKGAQAEATTMQSRYDYNNPMCLQTVYDDVGVDQISNFRSGYFVLGDDGDKAYCTEI